MSVRLNVSLLASLGACLTLGASSQAHAHATLHVKNADGAGEGFNDSTPAVAIGGNSGKTVGEQRLLAVQHAADLWGAVLDSDVTIEIEATFDDLGCSSGGAVLAQASPAGVDTGISHDGADPALIYPTALADRLAGEDQHPGEPDIVAFFNSSVGKSDCQGIGAWYYGFDVADAEYSDLVTIALHELGHGLGVSEFADLSTGKLLGGQLDAYTTHVLDISSGKTWAQMTDSERVSSSLNVRKVVWQGAHVTAAAMTFLDHGAPRLTTMPAVSGLTGIVSDADFGTRPLAVSVSAPLMLANPIDGCMLTPNVAGKIVLLRPMCLYSEVARMLAGAGALGALMVLPPSDRDTPPLSIEELTPATVSIPVLSITDADATRLQTALSSGSVTAQLSADSAVMLGADGMGQVMLNATQPVSLASSISHWDVSARPNLLMEPVSNPRQPNEVDLTGPMLIDLGWATFCGNGRLDQEETCDDGANNNDKTPDACRSDCRVAYCGDGVKDKAEACDHGDKNSDMLADACRTDCSAAHCGDGVRDKTEACDDGKQNSDSVADACRTDCKVARCGDGVKDTGEGCDQGAGNSDSMPDACRSSCKLAACGDGVTDQAEACDDGSRNSDSAADACRSNCQAARCGDGVMDRGEACDDGPANSDSAANACRSDCRLAHCGDGVKDRGESCDDGSGQCKTCKKGSSGGANTDADGGPASEQGVTKSCSCSVPGAARGQATSAFWLLLVVAAAGMRFRRMRSRRRLLVA